MSYPVYGEHIPTRWHEIGSIPAGWEARRLKFSVTLRNEKIVADDSPLKYMGLEHIESWTGRRIEDEAASSEGIATSFEKGDVLFGKLRPYLAKVYLAEQEGMATTEALILITEPALAPVFLKYLLLSGKFIDAVSGSTFGAKMPRANWEAIGGLPILLPSRDEQQKIAAFLDWKTGQIDGLIAKKKELMEKLTEKRLAVITQAVTKGLNAAVPLRDSGIPWLGDVPLHWEVIPIKFSLLNPITDGPHETPELFNEGIPFLSAEAVKNDKLDFDKKRGFISHEDHETYSKKYRPLRGDIYMVKSGATTGNVARVETDEDFNIWSPLAALRPDLNLATTDFIFYFMKSKSFFYSVELGWSFGTQQNIGMGVIANLKMACPPIEEQRQITREIDLRISAINAMYDKCRSAIGHLTEYRTALITAATTGKIDVRNIKNEAAV